MDRGGLLPAAHVIAAETGAGTATQVCTMAMHVLYPTLSLQTMPSAQLLNSATTLAKPSRLTACTHGRCMQLLQCGPDRDLHNMLLIVATACRVKVI